MKPVQQQYFTVDQLFSLQVHQKQTATNITMQFFYSTLYTAEIPHVVKVLKKHLPSVLLTQCFNEEGYPFHKEVRNTEIGHLFEHILLEYLCLIKMAQGARSATYSGKTKWNWLRDPKGTFYIRLTCGIKDADIFPIALEKTVCLMKRIMDQPQEPLVMLMPAQQIHGLKNGKQSQKIVKETE